MKTLILLSIKQVKTMFDNMLCRYKLWETNHSKCWWDKIFNTALKRELGNNCKITYSFVLWPINLVLDINFKDTVANIWKDIHWSKMRRQGKSWKDCYNSENLGMIQMLMKCSKLNKIIGPSHRSSLQLWSYLRNLINSKITHGGNVYAC